MLEASCWRMTTAHCKPEQGPCWRTVLPTTMQNLFCSFFHLFLSASPPVPPVQYYCSVSCFFCRRGVLLTTITILIGIKREHHWQKGSGFENPSSRIFQLDSILLVSCALSCNVIATNIFLCSECGTRN